MSLDATEQELYEFALAAMPRWFRELERTKEDLAAMAKVFGAAKKVGAYWLNMATIALATGPEAKDSGVDDDWAEPVPSGTLGPDWLQWHAEDRGSRRGDGETDEVMRIRLRTPPDAVTRSALIAAAQAIVDGQVSPTVTGTVDMVEMPRDAGYLGSFVADTNTGGVFSKVGDVVTFLPDDPFAFPPWFDSLSGRVKGCQITFSSCASGGNNGTFEIDGLTAVDDPGGDAGNQRLTAAYFTNASGVAETDGSCSWETGRLDVNDNVVDGWGRCFVNRGFRAWRGQSVSGSQKAMGGIIIILPYGTTAGTAKSVLEMLRKFKAAGIKGIVERRVGALP